MTNLENMLQKFCTVLSEIFSIFDDKDICSNVCYSFMNVSGKSRVSGIVVSNNMKMCLLSVEVYKPYITHQKVIIIQKCHIF